MNIKADCGNFEKVHFNCGFLMKMWYHTDTQMFVILIINLL